MWVCQNVEPLSVCHVILNEVKNLNTSTNAFQILRDAQDDNLIGRIHYDTPLCVIKSPYSNTTSPKNSGQWNFGCGRSIGLHERKCGVWSKSPHL